MRYLTVVSEQPEKLAGFYSTYFGLRELGKSENGDIALTDGFWNMSILKPNHDLSEAGFSHFGLEIDDIHEVEARLEEFAPHADIRAEKGDLFHGEYRVFDPNGVIVSLSQKQFNAPTDQRGLPAIRHVALSCPKNEEVLQFYMNVFGFREPSSGRRARQNGNTRFAADGSTSLAILQYPVDQDAEEPEGGWTARHFKGGVNHFGFLVPDIENFRAKLPAGTVSKRPATRPMTEYRVIDPEANEVDISEHKGYEIDDGVWRS